MQILHALAVNLGTVGRYVAALQQKLRQYAHAATDLQYVVGCVSVADSKRIAYFAGYVEVGQKVLTERFLCANFRHVVPSYTPSCVPICRKGNKKADTAQLPIINNTAYANEQARMT